jgi:hypothetical protein
MSSHCGLGDVESLRAYWDEQSPQRKASSASNELRGRKDLHVRSEGARLYGTPRLIIALVETRAEGPLRDPPPFVSKSQRVGSPTLVILRQVAGNWRLLVVGLLGYDINVADPAELFGYATQKPLPGGPRLSPAELLAPLDGFTIGEQPIAIKWKLPVVGPDAPRYWLVETIDDRGCPNVVLTQLSGSVSNGEMKRSVVGSRTAEIWTVPADGNIVFSARRTWNYRR